MEGKRGRLRDREEWERGRGREVLAPVLVPDLAATREGWNDWGN
jgi:hypothetical protein